MHLDAAGGRGPPPRTRDQDRSPPRAVRCGEVTLTAASRDAAALAIGPLYYRSTIEHAAAGPGLVDAVIAALGTWSD
ncbi:hypothetical protein [Actinoplanes sp. NPDC020271]|uniref:hypothetical protein n=1 Tax=Actinoplanes sp. NPDC020271 TaxID=3363896 RepID=UPI00379B2300